MSSTASFPERRKPPSGSDSPPGSGSPSEPGSPPPSAPGYPPTQEHSSAGSPHRGGPERLFTWLRGLGVWRNTSNRWVAGVCSGVADRLGVDPLVVRAAALLLLLFGGVGVLLYALAWALLPTQEGQIKAEQALRGDAGSIVLLAFVALVVVGEVTDHSRLWILLALGLALWLWARGSKRGSSRAEPGTASTGMSFGSSAQTPAPGPATADFAGSGPLLDSAASAAPTTSEPWPASGHGLGPGRTLAPSAPPASAITRPRRRGIGVLGVVSVVGLALVAYGAGAASGATSRPLALGLLCAVGTLGLALLVIGLLGRRAPGLAAVGIAATLAAALAVAAPASVSWSALRTGGVGEAYWVAPSGVPDPGYRLGAGSARLDLSALNPAATQAQPVSASVALGELLIVVPAGMSLEVDATVGAGEVVHRTGSREGPPTWRRDGSELRERVRVGSGPPAARVTADVGLGSVTVLSP